MERIAKTVKDAENHLSENPPAPGKAKEVKVAPAAAAAAPTVTPATASAPAYAAAADELCGTNCKVGVGVFTAALGVAGFLLSRNSK